MAWPVSSNTLAAASRALNWFAGAAGSGERSAVAVVVSSAGVGMTIGDHSAVGSDTLSADSVATAGLAGIGAACVRTMSAGADACVGRFSTLALLRGRILRVLGGVV